MPKITHEGLPLEVWLEIFRWATYTPCTISRPDPFVPDAAITDIMGYNTPFSSTKTKCSLVLVCRSWRLVATEILYEHIAIRSPRRANLILAALQGSRSRTGDDGNATNHDSDVYPNHGQWTRSMVVHTHARGGKSVRYLETVFRIMQYCPKVRMLKAYWNWVPPSAFLEAISRLYSQSLKSLLWNEDDIIFGLTCATPEFLSAFTSLRVLDLRHVAGCDLSSSLSTSPRPLLPRVTELLLSDTVPGFDIASALDLPAFHRLSIEFIRVPTPQFARRADLVTLANHFLHAHGPKITRLDIVSSATSMCIDARMFLRPGVCPDLRDLVIHESHPILTTQLSDPHPSLRRIGLRGVVTDKLYPDKTSTVTQHLRSFITDMFPSLEVVRTVGYLVESAVDSLAKDIFIWWAERFEKYGVDFQDGEGVLWMYTDAEQSDERQEVSSAIVPS